MYRGSGDPKLGMDAISAESAIPPNAHFRIRIAPSMFVALRRLRASNALGHVRELRIAPYLVLNPRAICQTIYFILHVLKVS